MIDCRFDLKNNELSVYDRKNHSCYLKAVSFTMMHARTKRIKSLKISYKCVFCCFLLNYQNGILMFVHNHLVGVCSATLEH